MCVDSCRRLFFINQCYILFTKKKHVVQTHLVPNSVFVLQSFRLQLKHFNLGQIKKKKKIKFHSYSCKNLCMNGFSYCLRIRFLSPCLQTVHYKINSQHSIKISATMWFILFLNSTQKIHRAYDIQRKETKWPLHALYSIALMHDGINCT